MLHLRLAMIRPGVVMMRVRIAVEGFIDLPKCYDPAPSSLGIPSARPPSSRCVSRQRFGTCTARKAIAAGQAHSGIRWESMRRRGAWGWTARATQSLGHGLERSTDALTRRDDFSSGTTSLCVPRRATRTVIARHAESSTAIALAFPPTRATSCLRFLVTLYRSKSRRAWSERQSEAVGIMVR